MRQNVMQARLMKRLEYIIEYRNKYHQHILYVAHFSNCRHFVKMY